MHVLLTGASGRIGSHILRLLLSEGHSVFAVDATPLPSDILEDVPAASRHQLTHREVNLSDIASVDGLFREDVKYDALIQFGSIPSPTHDDARVVHNNNVTGTYNILWTAAHRGGVRRMCQASSVNAIGMSFTKEEHWGVDYVPIDEKAPVRPPFQSVCPPVLHGGAVFTDLASMIELRSEQATPKVGQLTGRIIEAQASSLVRELPDLRIASLRLSLCVDSYDEAWPTSSPKNLWSWSSKDAVARAALLSVTSEGWEAAEVFNIFAPQITWEGSSVREEDRRKEGGPPDDSVGALELLEHYRPGRVQRVDESWWKQDRRRGFYDCRKAEKMLGWKHNI